MSKKKSIGILYICTGIYQSFWKGFHESFEAKFLPNTTKNYYIFTDKPEGIPQDDRVKVYYIDHLPWPLITLMRFHYFVKFRKEYEKDNDYLMFANSTLICRQTITEDEFLPNDSQELTVVIHPHSYKIKAKYCGYERNRKSTAYIPYNVKGYYVMGGLYCGETKKFMKMSETLASNVNKDLAIKLIARVDDESHINKYAVENRNVRVLTPTYGYAKEQNLPSELENKIEILNKTEIFDVISFKLAGGTLPDKLIKSQKVRKPLRMIKRFLIHRWQDILAIRDAVLLRHV